MNGLELEIVPARGIVVSGQSNSNRGRKRGSTAKACALRRLLAGELAVAPPAIAVEHRSRRAICASAGKAAAAAKREAKPRGNGRARARSAPLLPADREGVLALYDVPLAASGGSLFRNTAAQAALMEYRPDADSAQSSGVRTLERAILQTTLNRMSQVELAKKEGVSRQVVQRRTRLLAVCSFLCRTLRTSKRFTNMRAYLQSLWPGLPVEEMLWITKYKYDEMSMRCQARVKHQTETTLVKLLQTHIFWTALYRVGHFHVRVKAQLPATIKAIEACTTGCMRRALDCHVLAPPCSQAFPRKTRLPIRDMHPSNIAADETFYRDFPGEKLHGFHCLSHIEHKVASSLCRVFPNERKGCLHGCLAFSFGGVLCEIKEALKSLVRKHGQWHDSTMGPGEEEDQYRKSVWKDVMDVCTEDIRNIRTSVQAIYLQRKRLCNGRYRRRLRVDHFCPSRNCCRDAAHWVEQLCRLIDQELGPGMWMESRFLKIEDALEWFLFWMRLNGLLDEACSMVFNKGSKKPEAESDAEDEMGLGFSPSR